MTTTDNKIISFYSPTPNQGLKTISLAYASRLAAEMYRVLYVELDTTNRGLAQSLQIDTDKQNIIEYFKASVKGDFSFEPYVINKKMLIEESGKKNRSVFEQLEEGLDYLILPMNLNQEEVPNLLANDEEHSDAFVLQYVERIINAFKDSQYDQIVLKLPNDLDHMFTYPTMTNSDIIHSIISPSVNNLLDLKERKDFLFDHNSSLKEKWTNVINLASDEISNKDYEDMLGEAHIIHFDSERLRNEWALMTDSEYIRQQTEEIIDSKGIRITLNKYVNKKGFTRIFSKN